MFLKKCFNSSKWIFRCKREDKLMVMSIKELLVANKIVEASTITPTHHHLNGPYGSNTYGVVYPLILHLLLVLGTMQVGFRRIIGVYIHAFPSSSTSTFS